jgi:hypothetical protein
LNTKEENVGEGDGKGECGRRKGKGKRGELGKGRKGNGGKMRGKGGMG